MRHFEIEIAYCGHAFKYLCTSAVEALEVIQSVYDERHARELNYEELDRIIDALLHLKGDTGRTIHPVEDSISVTEAEGEV